jgi:hypothetical protein
LPCQVQATRRSTIRAELQNLPDEEVKEKTNNEKLSKSTKSLDKMDSIFAAEGYMDNSVPSRRLARHTQYLDWERSTIDQSRSTLEPNFSPKHKYEATHIYGYPYDNKKRNKR